MLAPCTVNNIGTSQTNRLPNYVIPCSRLASACRSISCRTQLVFPGLQFCAHTCACLRGITQNHSVGGMVLVNRLWLVLCLIA